MTAGDVRLTVTPEALTEKAARITARLQKIQQLLDILDQTAGRTRGYWTGEAGDLHRRMYEEEKPVIAEIMDRLREHPRDLCRIAEVYTAAEAAVRQTAEGLPENILR